MVVSTSVWTHCIGVSCFNPYLKECFLEITRNRHRVETPSDAPKFVLKGRVCMQTPLLHLSDLCALHWSMILIFTVNTLWVWVHLHVGIVCFGFDIPLTEIFSATLSSTGLMSVHFFKFSQKIFQIPVCPAFISTHQISSHPFQFVLGWTHISSATPSRSHMSMLCTL